MAIDRELTVQEAAWFAGVHQQTVWNWILAGKLPAHRKDTDEGRNKQGKGVAWRINASDFAEFMSKRSS